MAVRKHKYTKKSALNKSHEEFLILPDESVSHDIQMALTHLYEPMVKLLQKLKREQEPNYAFKFQLRVEIRMEKYSFENAKIVKIQSWFPGDTQVVLTVRAVRDKMANAVRSTLQRYDAFVQKGSGWTVDKVMRFSVSVSKYKLFLGGCARHKLPRALANLHAILSVNAPDDGKCFLYAVAAAVANKKRNPTRFCKEYRDIIAELPTHLLSYPVDLTSIEIFEKNCPISVNVYGYDKMVFPYRVTDKLSSELHANLLFYDGHYYTIRNMGRLVTKDRAKVNERKTYVCPYCLAYFVNQKRYNLHTQLCNKKCQQFKMPTRCDSIFTFKDFSKMVLDPFVAYCDLETCISPEVNVRVGKTISTKKHVAISCCVYIVCTVDPKYTFPPYIYTGTDCIGRMLDYLEFRQAEISQFLWGTNVPMTFTPSDNEKFRTATVCNMCRQSFSEMPSAAKVRDHCHITGKYRAALCVTCNLVYAKPSDKLSVFFHGLGNYDAHFIVAALGRYGGKKNIRIIPRTSEKYLSISVGNLIFKDSYQFMSGALAILASNLRAKGENNMSNVNRNIPPHLSNYFYRKGVFPYNFLSSPSVLEQTALPAQEHFFDDLSKKHVTDEEYAFAKDVWTAFDCKTIRDYMEVYLLADTLLLADCFETFRQTCMTNYELDPSYYFSNPHFSMSAFLRKGNITMQLLTDINMYLFFAKGIRGGVAMVGRRHATANNKYLSGYDSSKPSVFILNLDCTNLYGTAMTSYLPYSSFRWVPTDEVDIEKILSTPQDSDIGYVLECTLGYPTHVHDLHSDYPLAPERIKVMRDELSPYSQKILTKLKQKYTPCEKLSMTLFGRNNYILHYSNLQLYLRLGMTLITVHRVVSFAQRPIIKSYIDFNTQQRAIATNQFDQDYFKLMSNALYGKTMERPDKRTKINLETDCEKYEKRVSSLNYKSTKIINKDIVAIESKHECLYMTKPTYVGFTVLERAKLYMYLFWYDVLKPAYPLPGQLQLLYTDTDSLLVRIETEDLFDDLKQKFQKGTFDFSNYPKDHPLFSNEYKKVLGTFKDECGSKMISDFVGLRSKMYSYKIENDKEVKIAKGVKKSVVANDIKFSQYEKCLRENVETSNEFSKIQSINHTVYTMKVIKKSLSPFDDKRYILEDGIQTLPYGHYSLP